MINNILENVMKIKFLIGFDAQYCSSDFEELKQLSQKYMGPDEETFMLFKALELNNDLEKELIRARKNLRLPEAGLTWKEYKKEKIRRQNVQKKS